MNRAIFKVVRPRGRPPIMAVPEDPRGLPGPRVSLFARRGARQTRRWAAWFRYERRMYMRDWRAGRLPPAPHA